MASLLYLIYSLDINYTSHTINHIRNVHENSCRQTKIEGYVDDMYGTLQGTVHNIWDNIKSYVTKINNYYKNNYLINNIEKTQIMLITANQALKETKISLNNKSIGH